MENNQKIAPITGETSGIGKNLLGYLRKINTI
jgi:NADP-dependent 3-hydroxy acid dehydrogenase YdfG